MVVGALKCLAALSSNARNNPAVRDEVLEHKTILNHLKNLLGTSLILSLLLSPLPHGSPRLPHLKNIDV